MVHTAAMDMPDYDALNQRSQHGAAVRSAYWRRTRRLTAALLLAWFLVSFVLIYFARQLSFDFFGWPFGFWVASQGAVAVFCLIVAYYAWAMRRLDEQARAGEPHT